MLHPRDRKHFFLLSCLALGIILACSSLSPTLLNKPSGSIIFASDVSGNFEVYHRYFDGADPIRLTNNTSEDISPYYIPSSHDLGFVSDRSGKYQIYTMDLVGSDGVAWKKSDKRTFASPAISPDELQVVFVIQPDDKNSDLYLANADGTEERKLVKENGMDWDPSWSPDGTKITFTSDKSGNWELYVLTIADGNTVQLTDNKFFDGHPHWSPTGDKILFESDRDGDWDIYVMDADGKNVVAITQNASGDWMPNWSPDGEQIVYVSNRDGDDEIYVVDVNGQNQIKLTDNTAQDRYPIWIP